MNQQTTPYTKIIAQAWSDPEYRERLLRNPKVAMAEAGMTIPDNVEVKVHADTDEVIHIVLPASPAGEALSAQDLERVAGGTTWITGTPLMTVTQALGCPTMDKDKCEI